MQDSKNHAVGQAASRKPDRKSDECSNRVPRKRDPFGEFRLREIVRVMRHHHGQRYRLPFDDVGRAHLLVVVQMVLHLHGEPKARLYAYDYGRAWPPEEAEAIVTAAKQAEPPQWTADELARVLGVDRKTRELLRLRTIGATDYDWRERLRDRKARDRARKARKRRESGCKPHSQVKQWEIEGISRRTWFRRRAR